MKGRALCMNYNRFSVKQLSFTGNTVIDSNIVTNISIKNDLTGKGLNVGDVVKGIGVPVNTVIESVDSSTQVKLSNAVTLTVSDNELAIFNENIVTKRSEGLLDTKKIHGVPFDGTTDITIPEIDTLMSNRVPVDNEEFLVYDSLNYMRLVDMKILSIRRKIGEYTEFNMVATNDGVGIIEIPEVLEEFNENKPSTWGSKIKW